MPVYHITLHAYATWMPDRPHGSVHWKRGFQAADKALGDAYRARQIQPAASFVTAVQRAVVETILSAAVPQRLRVYVVSTDPSHVHFVCSWTDARSGEQVRQAVKQSVTMTLNIQFWRRTWLSRGGDVKRVWDQRHLTYLREKYLPSHVGVRWDEAEGWVDPAE